MKRRQFLGVSGAITTGVLGGESASFLRRNVGAGRERTPDIDTVPRRASRVRGRVADVEGAAVSVELVAQDVLESVRLVVARRRYPDGDVIAESRPQSVRVPNPGASVTVDVEVPSQGTEPGRWFYEAFVVDDDPAYLCESRPFRWRRRVEYGPSPAGRVGDARAPADRDGFRRTIRDNDYRLRYVWRDGSDRDWGVRYRVRRSAHEAAIARERGYVRTFEESRSNPYARNLARSIGSEAVPNSGRPRTTGRPLDLSDGEWFDLLVRFVQGLRYGRDAATMDEYDYNRTIEETLVAGVGDCKDKTHLLAGLLGAPPLECETAMLFQPAHVLLGVAAEDVPSWYDDPETIDLGGREYVAVDGSIRFDVGTYPDAPITAAYGDGGWIYVDAEAVGEGLDRNVRYLVEQVVAT